MRKSTFSRYDLLVLWLVDRRTGTPDDDQLLKFDQELDKNMSAVLTKIMTEEGVPLDKSSRSTVLLYSTLASGSNPTQKIRKACTFFKETAQWS